MTHAVDGAVRAAAQVLQHVHVGGLHVQCLGADTQRGAHVQVPRRRPDGGEDDGDDGDDDDHSIIDVHLNDPSLFV